jgi:hypothetical protein
MKSYYFPTSIHIFRLDTPETTTLEFESTFVVDEETQKEFKKISERRQSALAASSKNYVSGAITAISEYLPLVLGLMNAAEKLPADFSRYLRISWNSSLTSGFFKSNYYTHYNWYYEVIHILLVCPSLDVSCFLADCLVVWNFEAQCCTREVYNAEFL